MIIQKSITGIFFFLTVCLSAQKSESQSVSPEYFDSLKEIIYSRIPGQSRLAENQQSPLPFSMEDTLQKYDWYAIADYSNIENTYFSKWEENRHRLDNSASEVRFEILRFEEDGLMWEGYLDKHADGSFTLEKSLLPEERLARWIGVKYENGLPMLMTARHGVRQDSRILFYKDRLLIISTEAVPDALNSRIYKAYAAMDKMPQEAKEEDLPDEIIEPADEVREVFESVIEQKEETVDEPVKKKRKKKEKRKKRKKDKKKLVTVEFDLD